MRTKLPLLLLAGLGTLLVLLLVADVVDLGALLGGGEAPEPVLEEEALGVVGPVADAAGPTLAGRADEAALAAEAERAQAAREAAAAGPDGGGPKGSGVPFAGRVLDPDGRPAAEVRIVATRESGEVFRLATDGEGRFSDALPPGRYRLELSAPRVGYRRIARALIDGSAEEAFEFRLAEPAAFELAVLRGDEGVVGVRVALRPRGADEEDGFAAVTDVDGVAHFEELPRARYRMEAEVPDGPRLLQDLNVWGDRSLRVRIPGSAMLHGTVREGPDGPPVAGAEITLRVVPPRSGTELETRFTSGPDGTYDVSVPKGYARYFLVEAEGFAPYPNPADRAERRQAFRTLNRLVKKAEITQVVPLRSGASVTGRVTDGDGNPIEGVELVLEPRRGQPVSVTTGATGRYAAAELNPDRYRILVETPQWFAEKPLGFTIPRGATAPVDYDFVLKGARRFTGVVVSAAGQGVYGARVWIIGGGRPVNSARQAGRALETFTEDAGRWALADVPAEISVVVRASYGDQEAKPVGVPHEKPVPASIRLVLAETGSLAGDAYDLTTRAGLANTRIRLRPVGRPWGRSGRTVGTNREGRYRIDRLIPGRYQVTPGRTGYLASDPVGIDVRAGEDPTTLDLPLDPGLVFAGVVLDERGRGLRAARVGVWGQADGKPVRYRAVNTDAQGRFRLTGYRSGTYTLRVRRGRYRPRTFPDLRGGEADLRVELQPR